MARRSIVLAGYSPLVPSARASTSWMQKGSPARSRSASPARRRSSSRSAGMVAPSEPGEGCSCTRNAAGRSSSLPASLAATASLATSMASSTSEVAGVRLRTLTPVGRPVPSSSTFASTLSKSTAPRQRRTSRLSSPRRARSRSICAMASGSTPSSHASASAPASPASTRSTVP